MMRSKEMRMNAEHLGILNFSETRTILPPKGIKLHKSNRCYECSVHSKPPQKRKVPVSEAEVTFPYEISQQVYDGARSAFSYLSMSMLMSEQPPAGIHAARAHGIGRNHDEDDVCTEDLILTVDYSDAALTTLLLSRICSVFEVRRELHNTTLGASKLTASTTTGADSANDDLMQALRQITTLPLDDDGNGVELKQISDIVLLGDRADDPRLHEA
ncbi:MAG: hypothetical protein Q9227_005166 [Pyrenula ochraceoflavens]